MTPALRWAAMKSQDSVHKRPQKQEGLLGTGTSGKRGQKSETSKWAPTWKTKAAVDLALSPLRTTGSVRLALRSDHHTTQLLSQLLCRIESQRKIVPSSAVGKQLKQKKSSSLSGPALYLPAFDLSVWASFFVTASSSSPPPGLAPGLCRCSK